mmetsp:Transcript_2967/g.5395  ORF Transcript_2967/g.5395 Transcript_2967/m.5395 type:complete len:113 (+) Transcript_2967:2004-2342(+)
MQELPMEIIDARMSRGGAEYNINTMSMHMAPKIVTKTLNALDVRVRASIMSPEYLLHVSKVLACPPQIPLVINPTVTPLVRIESRTKEQEYEEAVEQIKANAANMTEIRAAP